LVLLFVDFPGTALLWTLELSAKSSKTEYS
jgi:hypothetical protein